MLIAFRVALDNFNCAVGGSAIDDDVFNVRAILLNYIQNAGLDEAYSIENRCYDG